MVANKRGSPANAAAATARRAKTSDGNSSESKSTSTLSETEETSGGTHGESKGAASPKDEDNAPPHVQERSKTSGVSGSEKSPQASTTDPLRREDGDSSSSSTTNANSADGGSTLITTSTRSYFSAELVNRLNTLNNYRSYNTGCVTLHSVIFKELNWGPVGNGYPDRSEFLELNGRRLMLWSIGEVILSKFAFQGRGVRKAKLLFRPVLDEDFGRAQKLLNHYSRPIRKASEVEDGVWASRWMGSQSTPDHELPLFDRVYDALDVYGPKQNMEKYTSDLKRGDIVLVEMYVTRWTVKDDATDKGESKPSYGKKREWKRWNVEFRLDAISVLYPGSDYAEEDAREDEEFQA